ncbi:MAG: YggT family protein [Alphaproteobacteria bacterium]
MVSLVMILSLAIEIYIWIIVASAVVSWLIAFNVVNQHHSFVRQVLEFLYKVTEPVLKPIRNALPDLGGIDISPIIVIFALIFLRSLMFEYLV